MDIAPATPIDSSTDVLGAVCALLPPEVAGQIRGMDPHKYETFVDAYVAIRRNAVQVDPGLLNRLVEVLFDFHDAEAEAFAPVEPEPVQVPAQRRRLTLVSRVTPAT